MSGAKERPRGRSRGRGIVIPNTVSQNPGQSQFTESHVQVQNQQSTEKLTMDLLKALRPNSLSDTELAPLLQQLRIYLQSEEKQKEAVDALYSRVEEDWKMADVIATVAGNLINDPEFGARTRTKILQVLQKYEHGSAELRESNLNLYLSYQAMMCQCFRHLKVENKFFPPLLKSSLKVLEMLLDNKSTEKELECAAEQMMCIGAILYQETQKDHSNQFRSIINNIRNVIVDSRGSTETRSIFIDIIECHASGWKRKSELKH